ncbi:Uncharacterized protein TCM_045297 [Theobroma cacao]|uniref:Uncharacterized protein n=1 Tax=Theobroma cacao TaxID=3641 RepID=A0A061FSL0_THECC|nr:Uncharacterized protein TCM_045297 [Theobroma cacao]
MIQQASNANQTFSTLLLSTVYGHNSLMAIWCLPMIRKQIDAPMSLLTTVFLAIKYIDPFKGKEYERLKQQSTRIQEWGESYRQAYTEKYNQMDYLVWQMREVAYKARSMAWKTDILRSQIFPVGKHEQQLIKYLDEVYSHYNKIGEYF